MAEYIAKPSVPRLNMAHPLAQNLVFAMPFSFGKNAIDLSGRSNHGTLNDTINIVSSSYGSTFNFAGSAAYVNIPASDDFDLRTYTDSWTISCLVNTNDTTSNMFWSIGSTDYQCICLYFESNSSIRIVGSSNGTGWTLVLRGLIASINTWYHIIVVNDRSAIALYVDNQDGESGGLAADFLLNNYIMKIGIHYSLYGPWNFTGEIENVMLWRRALNHVERSKLFSDPFCMYRFQKFYSFLPSLGIGRPLVNGGLVNKGLVNGGLVG